MHLVLHYYHIMLDFSQVNSVFGGHFLGLCFLKSIFWAFCPRGVLPNKEVGGLGPLIKFGGKIWGKVRPSSPNNRKNLGSSVTTRRKRLGKSHNFGVISEIQRAKFGVFVIYIFRGKIWGSNKNFRGKIWGQAPHLLIWKYPPWSSVSGKVFFWG